MECISICWADLEPEAAGFVFPFRIGHRVDRRGGKRRSLKPLSVPLRNYIRSAMNTSMNEHCTRKARQANAHLVPSPYPNTQLVFISGRNQNFSDAS